VTRLVKTGFDDAFKKEYDAGRAIAASQGKKLGKVDT
jgi:hypothetical protein